MPVTTTYPGVYIEELPSGVHTITGVATSILPGDYPLDSAEVLVFIEDFILRVLQPLA